MRIFYVERIDHGRVNGLRAKYYTLSEFEDLDPETIVNRSPTYQRIDQEINFVWYDDPVPKVPLEKFAVLWEGILSIESEEGYVFFIDVDDGAQLWIDEELIIDAWYEQALRRFYSKVVKLSKGFHSMKLIYFNKGPFAIIRLGWIRESGLTEIIPRYHFITDSKDFIIVKGVPSGFKVELWNIAKIAEATSINGVATLPLHGIRGPIEGSIKIIDSDGKTVFETKFLRDIWGGDILILRSQ